MPRPLSPRAALARAIASDLEYRTPWDGLSADEQRYCRESATRQLRVLKRFGFEIVPVKTVRVKRRKAAR